MDAEDFELAVAVIILLRELGGKCLKEHLENNGFALYLKIGKENVHIFNLSGKTLIIKVLAFFPTCAKASSSLRLHLFVFLLL